MKEAANMSGFFFCVGLPGLEPGKAGPESAVLPLHHSPIIFCECKGNDFFRIVKNFFHKFCSKGQKVSFFT